MSFVIPPNSQIRQWWHSVVHSLQSPFLWQCLHLCLLGHWHGWRVQDSLGSRIWPPLGVSNVSSWKDSDYELLVGISQKWSCIGLRHTMFICSITGDVTFVFSFGGFLNWSITYIQKNTSTQWNFTIWTHLWTHNPDLQKYISRTPQTHHVFIKLLPPQSNHHLTSNTVNHICLVLNFK